MWRNLRYDWPLHIVLVLTNLLPDNVIVLRLRGFLAHFFFANCGTNLRLGRNLVFYNPSRINFGSDVYIAYGTWFSAGGEIVVEDEVIVGPYSVLASSNHSKANGSFRYGNPICQSIRVGRGSWLGAHSVVTAGCTIGTGSLVGTATVVTKDVPDSVLFAGNPGRVVRDV